MEGVSFLISDVHRPVAASPSAHGGDDFMPERNNQRSFPILYLPDTVISEVFACLPTLSRLALAATCRALRQWSPNCYKTIAICSHSLRGLANALEKLCSTLDDASVYSASVRSFFLSASWAFTESTRPYYGPFMKRIDTRLGRVLGLTFNLRSLTIDFSPTAAFNPLPFTLKQILAMRSVYQLALYGIRLPSYSAARDLPLPSSLTYRPAFQRITLEASCGDWLCYLVDDARAIEWLSLHLTHNRDPSHAMAIHRIASGAVNLRVLLLTDYFRQLDLERCAEYLRLGFQSHVLDNLRAVSIATTATPSATHRLVQSLFYSNLTHLRLVVYMGGAWIPEFGPPAIAAIASHVPRLQELVLDQLGMTKVCALPGNLNEWAAAFRRMAYLRRLVFHSLFVLDVNGPFVEPEDDYPDGVYVAGGPDDDLGVAVAPAISDDAYDYDYEYDDDDDDDDAASTPSTDSDSDTPSDGASGRAYSPDSALKCNLILLAAWAETFLDEHLRLRGPFEELWFVGVRGDGPAAAAREMAVGYRQIAYEDVDRQGVRSTRFMITPAAGGWTCWWSDRGREDLRAAFHR